MINYIIAIPIVVGFLATLFLIPSWIKAAKKAKFVGKDMHKFENEEIAEGGGLPVVAGFTLGVLIYIALVTFFFEGDTNLIEIFAIVCVVLIASFVGFVDDLFGWKIGLSKKLRMFLVIASAIPLIVINAGESLVEIPFVGSVNLGLIYPLIIIPIGVLGASTTFNFLAGYNGLEARQGILILGALGVATWFMGNRWLTTIILCMIAPLIAFLFFNAFPARIFPGDVMTYSVGVLIATIAIMGNIERFAVFIFIPNIIEVFLKIRGKLRVESFGKPNKDGELDTPYKKIYSLSHIAIKILEKSKGKAYEKDIVLLINVFQLVVIVIGFILFRRGIFG